LAPRDDFFFVIAGLDPAIPIQLARHCQVIEMPATSAGMTESKSLPGQRIFVLKAD
jgi:hypothetical protein